MQLRAHVFLHRPSRRRVCPQIGLSPAQAATFEASLGRMTWSEQAADVIARRQLIAAGLTPAQARRGMDSHRWQRVHPGVYAAFTGPLGSDARIWSALLAAGPGAVASGDLATDPARGCTAVEIWNGWSCRATLLAPGSK